MKGEKKLEKDIQREICDELFEILKNRPGKRFIFWRSNNIPVWGRSNDGVKRWRAMPKYTPKGLPDITVIYEGRYYAIEVKRPGCFLSDDQIDMSSKIILCGGVYCVMHSVDDIKKQLPFLYE